MSLRLKLVSLDSSTTLVDLSLPVTHVLRDFSVTAGEGSAWLSWMEREEGVMSTLWLAEIREDGGVLTHMVWQSAAVADTPEVVVGEDGLLYIAFTASDYDGMAEVKVICWDIVRAEVRSELRLTDGTAVARRPVIAVDGDELHVVFFRETITGADVMYQRHQAQSGQMLASLSLGLAPENMHTPSIMLARDGALHVVWQTHTGIGEQVVAGRPTYGTILGGQWVRGPQTLAASHSGRVYSVRAYLGADETIVACWVAESGGTWQSYVTVLDSEGSRLASGFATLAPSDTVEPRPLRLGQNNVLSYARITPTGTAEVSFVTTDHYRRVSLAYRIGLNSHNPWADAVYKYFTLLLASFGLAFTGTGALLVALLIVFLLVRLKLFSGTGRGEVLRFLVLFSVLAMLKRPGSYLYYKALIMPGWVPLLSWVGSATFSLAIIHLSNVERDDSLILGSAGLLFMVCDSFVSLYITGVGSW